MVRHVVFASAAAGLLLSGNLGRAWAQEASPPPAAAPAPAGMVQSQPSSDLAVSGPTVWGGVGYFGLYGLGASYMIPVADGVLKHPTIRDRFAIEFGATYLRRSYGYLGAGDYTWNEVVPVAGVLWSVWLLPKLAVYPKLDIGYAFGWLSNFNYCEGIPNCSNPSYGGVFVNASAGVIYNVGTVSLRGEVGNELIKGGLAFLF